MPAARALVLPPLREGQGLNKEAAGHASSDETGSESGEFVKGSWARNEYKGADVR